MPPPAVALRVDNTLWRFNGNTNPATVGMIRVYAEQDWLCILLTRSGNLGYAIATDGTLWQTTGGTGSSMNKVITTTDTDWVHVESVPSPYERYVFKTNGTRWRVTNNATSPTQV